MLRVRGAHRASDRVHMEDVVGGMPLYAQLSLGWSEGERVRLPQTSLFLSRQPEAIWQS